MAKSIKYSQSILVIPKIEMGTVKNPCYNCPLADQNLCPGLRRCKKIKKQQQPS